MVKITAEICVKDLTSTLVTENRSNKIKSKLKICLKLIANEYITLMSL